MNFKAFTFHPQVAAGVAAAGYSTPTPIQAQAIPIVSIDKVIIDRVNATSPQNLEMAVQGIVKSELQAIVNLGGILGFLVGTFQTLLLLLR